jgi:hypothetical protein
MMNENQSNPIPDPQPDNLAETHPNPVSEPPSDNLAETQPNEASEPQVDNLAETQSNPVSEPQADNLAETRPNEASEPQTENPELIQPQNSYDSGSDEINDTKPHKIAKPSRSGFWISLVLLVAAIGLGSVAGYGRGVSERVSAQGTLVAQQLGAQFNLVQQDLDAGRYSVARQRLEYIISQDPSYPGVAEKLAKVLVEQAITPSPIPTETPTLTPTPDLRSQDAIFAQAQQQLNNKDWTALMGSLDSLRKADPTYKAANIDSMYYTALRNRGMDQILGSSVYKTTNLEGGIYDLTLAERFGPLDGYADGLRSFSRLYIRGASFWDVDWKQASDIFRQVKDFAPNLRDSSNVTASQRLFRADLKYGDQLAALQRSKDYCTALDIWNEAASIAPLGDEYTYKFNQLNERCNPPTEVPSETPTPLVQ